MPIRVLVVDDDLLFRQSISQALSERTYDVVGQAATASEARHGVARLRPDAILLDVNLPDGDGFSLARQLLSTDSRLRVLLTSSDSATAPPRLVKQSGARGFVAKDALLTIELARYLGEMPRPGPDVVGTVTELWRYPVKSMLGTRVDAVQITRRGVLGDRAWALRDLESGRIASAKRFHRLLDFRAGYERDPTPDARGRAWIRTPDGELLHTDDPDISQRLSRLLGHPLRLEERAQADEKTGIDRTTVFGDVPVSDMKPEWTPDTMPDYFQLMSGTFLEIGPVHLLASGSVEHLRRLQGGTAQIDRRRFRTNIYIDTPAAGDRFVEDDWLGGTLRVGGDVTLTDLEPTVWCVTSTLAQEELPRDLSVLRTIAQRHRGCLGVYANVPSQGAIRVGDPITLLT